MAIRDNKWSDLHIAVGSKEIKLVEALCNEKNINATDAKCRTPLELAILGHDLETVKFLVQMGGKINGIRLSKFTSTMRCNPPINRFTRYFRIVSI